MRRSAVLLALSFLPLPVCAEDLCYRDADCADGLVCICVRHLVVGIERCDELGGVCRSETPEFAPQRIPLERQRARRQVGLQEASGDPGQRR